MLCGGDGDGFAGAADDLINFFGTIGTGEAVDALVWTTSGLSKTNLAYSSFTQPKAEHLFHSAFLYLEMAC